MSLLLKTWLQTSVGDSQLRRFVLWDLHGLSWTPILLRTAHLVVPWGWERLEMCRGKGGMRSLKRER